MDANGRMPSGEQLSQIDDQASRSGSVQRLTVQPGYRINQIDELPMKIFSSRTWLLILGTGNLSQLGKSSNPERGSRNALRSNMEPVRRTPEDEAAILERSLISGPSRVEMIRNFFSISTNIAAVVGIVMVNKIIFSHYKFPFGNPIGLSSSLLYRNLPDDYTFCGHNAGLVVHRPFWRLYSKETASEACNNVEPFILRLCCPHQSEPQAQLCRLLPSTTSYIITHYIINVL